jgi:hypothetical protein
VNVNFSGSRAATIVSRTGVAHTPRSVEDVDLLLVLVLGILRLAIDRVDFYKHVYCHIYFTLC